MLMSNAVPMSWPCYTMQCYITLCHTAMSSRHGRQGHAGSIWKLGCQVAHTCRLVSNTYEHASTSANAHNTA
eukprot:383-Lingulodinium_polyedra.AAC.1